MLDILKKELCNVPGGTFLMGADFKVENLAEVEDGPPHVVDLRGFKICENPITADQWDWFLDESEFDWRLDSSVRQLYLRDGFDFCGMCPSETPKLRELMRCYSPSSNHPAVWMSWNHIQEFIKWLNANDTGGRWNLPTEAQWEKAARGTDGRRFPWGNFNGRCLDEYMAVTNFSVGSYPAHRSAFGCLDMWDNVCEWCRDWFDDEFYEHSPVSNPMGPEQGSQKSVRGGRTSMSNWPLAAHRRAHHPHEVAGFLGFRLVWEEY